MMSFRLSTTSSIIAAASLLPEYQAGAHAVSLQHLRKLNTDDYTSLGCFKDSKDDRILGNKLSHKSMTTEMCFTHCDEMGAPLMATQWGKECWCATEVDVEYTRHGEGAECDYKCAGNQDEICGGFDAITLYVIESHMTSDDNSIEDHSPALVPVPASFPGDSSDDNSSEDDSPAPVPASSDDDFPAPVPASGGLDGAFSPDIVNIINVVGDDPGGIGWADSYSVGDKCYMYSNFDHDIGGYTVDTPQGTMTISNLYDKLKEGPGHRGHPLYNDIQCGNGPANSAPDEEDCPGLVEFGREGCGQIGPLWDLTELE